MTKDFDPIAECPLQAGQDGEGSMRYKNVSRKNISRSVLLIVFVQTICKNFSECKSCEIFRKELSFDLFDHVLDQTGI